ncbi:MAG: long-chain fatty acid--CoA ligase [Clostridia bacterium]|nr:long-chain fatty acid--CoA ligase [Clostridia bacterium]
MKENLPIAEQLKKKYHKTDEVTNFKEMLYRSADIYRSRTAFKKKDETGNIIRISYEQFKNDIVSLGTSLIEKGFLNKRISVIGKNSYQWCVSYLAASIVGIVVPIDKELHTDDVINFMNVSQTVCILGDSKNLDSILANIEKVENPDTFFASFDNQDDKNSFENLLTTGKTTYQNGKNDFDKIEIDPDELRILLFTSGTTGNAKGVCLSQRNICSNILSTYGIVKVKRSDLFFSILPLHHTYECTLGFLLPIYSGAAIAHCEGLRYITKNLGEFHPSVILCVPLLLENVHKNIVKNMNKSLPEKYRKTEGNPFNDLPFYLKKIVRTKVKNTLGGRLRVFIVGAAAANPDIVSDFKDLKLMTLQGYGLTECSPLVAGNTDFFQKDDAAGLPIPNVEYKIDNPNSEGIGEIIVKGPNVMLGYYEDEEKTNQTIINGWFHTGDLGRIDENGYLYITGRCKSVIVTKNGKNIYPEEVEYYLNDNPLISEALVLGIHKEDDDETYINAQIYPNIEAITEYLKGSVPTKEEIWKIIADSVSAVNKKLPNYKHIKSFGIRDKEFEKTTTQKIKRYGDNMKVDKKNEED